MRLLAIFLQQTLCNMSKFLRCWFPALFWMGFIFTLSSRHSVEVSSEYIVNFLIFKTLHVIEYATLYLLLFRGFYAYRDKKVPFELILMKTAIWALLYAASDEFHQTLTPHRDGNPRDVLIDSIGIFLMYSYIKYYFSGIKRFLLL